MVSYLLSKSLGEFNIELQAALVGHRNLYDFLHQSRAGTQDCKQELPVLGADAWVIIPASTNPTEGP